MPEDMTTLSQRPVSDSGLPCMKCIKRASVTESFEVDSSTPIPLIPKGGARIKVCYAGACYTEQEVKNSGQKTLRNPGIHDTSLFPGYEVSGIIDGICNTITKSSDNKFHQGDKVIVYPDDQEISNACYEEYICIRNVENLIKIPESLPMPVACLLPCGALTAYTAVLRAKPHVEDKISTSPDSIINILVVGAGGLGLWTIQMARYLLCGYSSKIHVTVADTCIEKLMMAKNYGCFDVIHWNDAIHEEHLITRTRDVCPQGVDVVIDFVSSLRTVSRSLKVLNEEGVLVVGGNSKYQINLCLNSLASKNQSILGVRKGSRKHLKELVELCAAGKITPPQYSVFLAEDANKVFEKLNQCKLYGRAVLKISESEDDEEHAHTHHRKSALDYRTISSDSKCSDTVFEEDEDNIN